MHIPTGGSIGGASGGAASNAHMRALADVFRSFARRECRGSSPLYERLALGVAEDPALLEMVLELSTASRPGQPVPNLLLGAVHALLLRGVRHPLAAYFPDLVAPPAQALGDPMPAFAAFCAQHRAALGTLLATQLVQTNEVRRCACLLPAFALAARLARGRPLALIEIGASAGLNLLWDHYAFDYGMAGQIGHADATVRLTCAVRGPRLPLVPRTMPLVGWRLGIDLHPVDVQDPDAVAWLRALIWPEHRERSATLDAAIAIARQTPPRLLAGDALELLTDALEAAPAEALVCVYHSFTLNQFAPVERRRWRTLLAKVGRRRELCQISLEYRLGHAAPQPTLAFSHSRPGALDEPERALAICHPHGAWIAWRSAEGRRRRHARNVERDVDRPEA